MDFVDLVKELELWKWNFVNDGMYGHIYFLIRKGRIAHSSNNGAHCRSLSEFEIYDLKENNAFSESLDFSEYDCVHVSTPCMEHGEDLGSMKLDDIVNQAIFFIQENI